MLGDKPVAAVTDMWSYFLSVSVFFTLVFETVVGVSSKNRVSGCADVFHGHLPVWLTRKWTPFERRHSRRIADFIPDAL